MKRESAKEYVNRMIRQNGHGQNSIELPKFDESFHAGRSAHAKRDTSGPCKICGWAKHMAIHDVGNRAVVSPCGRIGHAYEPPTK